jgi:hydrogenase-4 membrane subunit HyfE
MKINVSSIVSDHFSTLYDDRSNSISKIDIFVFYIFPIALAMLTYWYGFSVTEDTYNVSITFFGIFIALLLNIQVAIFAIFQRKWDIPSDEKLAKIQKKTVSDRKTLLTELNANISYLILVCCVALVSVLVFYMKKYISGIPPSIAVFMYGHFILTLIMIVKRSHALFQKEYRDSPD